jgi:6-phosphogluconolactonase
VDELPALQRIMAQEFAALASAAMARGRRFVVALPGGSVAHQFFPTLAALDVDWDRVEFFWVDERAVPRDDSESNYALAATLWLVPARVPAERIHRLHGDQQDLARAAERAAEELVAIAGNPPQLDLAIVGVGEDGHVGSIFSSIGTSSDGGTGLQPCSPPFVTAIYDAPKPPPRRLTLTLGVLSSARQVIIAALGASKARAIGEALNQHDCTTPVAALLRHAPASLVLLDPRSAMNARTYEPTNPRTHEPTRVQ